MNIGKYHMSLADILTLYLPYFPTSNEIYDILDTLKPIHLYLYITPSHSNMHEI